MKKSLKERKKSHLKKAVDSIEKLEHLVKNYEDKRDDLALHIATYSDKATPRSKAHSLRKIGEQTLEVFSLQKMIRECWQKILSEVPKI